MNKFAIIGQPGAGKSTQASMLARSYDLVRICVGDIFRWNIRNHTKLGARVRQWVEAAQLAPDDIVVEAVRSRLQQHDWNYGFVLDGFPTSCGQAEFLLESYDIDGVIWLQVPDEVSLERLSNLVVCPGCGLDYNLLSRPRRFETSCEVCGAKLINRRSPSVEESQDRLCDYRARLEPALGLFRQKELVVAVQGARSPEEIHQDIQVALGFASEAMRQILTAPENRPENP